MRPARRSILARSGGAPGAGGGCPAWYQSCTPPGGSGARRRAAPGGNGESEAIRMRALSESGPREAWRRDPDAEARALPILVAEDEESSRSALCEVLRDGGYDAIGASDGLELLERVAETPPAAVILDLAMPRLNGMEVAAALRSNPATREVPIIAITASWLAERGDLLAAAGFDAALRKPFTAERLLAELRRALGREDAEEGAGVSGADPHPW